MSWFRFYYYYLLLLEYCFSYYFSWIFWFVDSGAGIGPEPVSHWSEQDLLSRRCSRSSGGRTRPQTDGCHRPVSGLRTWMPCSKVRRRGQELGVCNVSRWDIFTLFSPVNATLIHARHAMIFWSAVNTMCAFVKL